MHCPACGAQTPPGKKFCAECGAALPKACPDCGSLVGADDKFCGECGKPLIPTGTSVPPAAWPTKTRAAEATGERRQVTVMFVDLVGSTTLSAQLDPEDFRELLATYHEAVAGVVETHGGHVAQFLGDGALIYFGYPVNHEDDGERSMRAGLSLLERMRGVTIHGADIKIRIGVATGLVVVGDKATGSDAAHEPRIMGETPNIAARLQSLAQPGEIVVAESTRQLVGSLFQYASLGAVELKGVPRPVTAWKVVGPAEVDDRFKALRSAATPFIGREEELDLLSRRWRQVAEEGGKAVLISGEPGVGKSRLTATARDRFGVGDDRIVTYFCSQNFTSTALFPVVRHIARTCGLSSDETNTNRRQKLSEFAGPFATAEALALLTELLSAGASEGQDDIAHLSPAERRKATFELLIQHLVSMSDMGPIAIVFEDIHWADPSTLELLDLLIARIEAHRILLIATFRPEFHPTWAGSAHVTLLTLTRLPANQRRRMIEAVAGASDTLPPELVDEIAERTDGVPLFVEELTKAAVEAGAAGDLTRTAGKSPVIPATLHASLMARLDRLGSIARQVAQTGAVIGREFSAELLKSVWPGSSFEMARALDQLRNAGLIFARSTGDDASYVFKHALVQDAAYSMLLRAQKKAIHGAVAHHLVERSDATNLAELVARHYAEAQEPALAAEWRLTAGKASNRRTAYFESVENLRQGLSDAVTLPDGNKRKELELALNVALTVPYSALYSQASPQATEVLERAEELSKELGTALPEPVLYHRYLMYLAQGQHARAYRVGREGEKTTRQEALRIRFRFARISTMMFAGRNVAKAKVLFEDTFSQYEAFGSEVDHLRFEYLYEFKASRVTNLNIACWYAGFPDLAARYSEIGRQRAREIRHSMTLCVLSAFEFQVHEARGDLAALEACAAECFEIASRGNLGLFAPWALLFSGFVRAMRGNAEGVLQHWDEVLSWLDGLRFLWFRPYLLSLRSRMLDLDGRGDEAIATVDQGIALALSGGEKVNLSELRRLRGELLIRYRGPDAEPEAEREFYEALAFARKQKALSYELRASHALANLMRSRGNDAGALDLLERVFNRFTEGFDTADLVAAKRTIDELKSRRDAAAALPLPA